MIASWSYPNLIAHRCGGDFAPENTLEGMDAAAQRGFGMVEFDVMLAGCGTPVLIHDETLERTSNGQGSVSAAPYHELAELDVGSWFGPRFAGARMPTLLEALECALAKGLSVNVEIKPARGFDRATGETVARRVREAWTGEPAALLSSFSVEALSAARGVAPDVPRGMLFEALPPDWLAVCQSVGAVSVHCDYSQINGEGIRAVRAAGYPLLCYTVNDRPTADGLLANGVSGVFTDSITPR